MVKILVTGSGIIGQWLVEKLKSRGHYVFGADLTHGIGEIGYLKK